MAYYNYLDFYDLFVNQVAGGNEYIFIMFMFIIITFMAAKFRFPNQVTLMMLFLFSLVMAFKFPSVLAITLMIAGFGISYGLGKAFQN